MRFWHGERFSGPTKAGCILNQTKEVLNRDVFIEDAEPKVLPAPELESLPIASTSNGAADSNPSVADTQTVTPRQKRRTRTCWQRLLLTALVLVGSLYGLITIGRSAFDNFIHEQETQAASSRTQQVLVTLQSLASSLTRRKAAHGDLPFRASNCISINIMARPR